MIFKNIFAEKFGQKFGVLTRNKAKLCKIMIKTLVFEKNANFFAKNCQKSQKIVIIITSTPGHPAASKHVEQSSRLCCSPRPTPSVDAVRQAEDEHEADCQVQFLFCILCTRFSRSRFCAAKFNHTKQPSAGWLFGRTFEKMI
jgi:hypothetical protein